MALDPLNKPPAADKKRPRIKNMPENNNLMQEGVELMLVGMGVGFAFLVLLVVFMTLSGAFFQKFSHLFAEPKQPDAPAAKKADYTAARVAVAIAAAHRTKYDQ